ncbi:MAG: ribonuclease catalytic domain-containing protein [Planctomycetota bacterium]
MAGSGGPWVGRVEREHVARALFPPEREQPAPEQPRGAVVRVEACGAITPLAAPGSAAAQVYELLARHGVDPLHPPEVLAEAEAAAAAPGISDPALVDLTGLPFVTIDGEASRDLDQALHVARAAGGYRLDYALADASYYVRPGTALLEESLRRGTSYYVPGMSAPMLPRALSEGLISLNPAVERRALVFRHELDAAGRCARTEVVRARVRSRAKLSYAGVQRFVDAPAAGPLAGQEYSESLLLLREVGELRLRLAEERGVVEYDRTELEVELASDGGFRVEVRERLASERWNEQVSLLCNMEGAALLEAGGPLDHVQPVFRVHPPPLAGRLEELEAAIAGVVRQQGLDEAWRWRRDAEELGAYLARVAGRGEARRALVAIERQVRYANRASEFRPEPGPHYALRVQGYARFSAPMREVVGIFTHKEALERLGLAKPPPDPASDEALRARAIEAANEARLRQRALTKEAEGLAIDELLRDDLALPPAGRPARRGTVIGVASSRLYVALDEFPIDLKVYREDLEALHGQAYQADRALTQLSPKGAGDAPRFRMGDGVTLRTHAYDDQRRRWAFDARLESS